MTTLLAPLQFVRCVEQMESVVQSFNPLVVFFGKLSSITCIPSLILANESDAISLSSKNVNPIRDRDIT